MRRHSRPGRIVRRHGDIAGFRHGGHFLVSDSPPQCVTSGWRMSAARRSMSSRKPYREWQRSPVATGIPIRFLTVSRASMSSGGTGSSYHAGSNRSSSRAMAIEVAGLNLPCASIKIPRRGRRVPHRLHQLDSEHLLLTAQLQTPRRTDRVSGHGSLAGQSSLARCANSAGSRSTVYQPFA